MAKILGLSHYNTVTTYLKRYPYMPRPLLDYGHGRWTAKAGEGASLIEHLNAASPTTYDPVPTYCALRTRRELYAAYGTGEEEY